MQVHVQRMQGTDIILGLHSCDELCGCDLNDMYSVEEEVCISSLYNTEPCLELCGGGGILWADPFHPPSQHFRFQSNM